MSFWLDDIKKIKVGNKLRKEEDDTIWEITKQIDKNHFEITCTTPTQKGNYKKATISTKSVGYTTKVNIYEFTKTITISQKIYADSEAEARKQLKSFEEELVIDGEDFVLTDSDEVL